MSDGHEPECRAALLKLLGAAGERFKLSALDRGRREQALKGLGEPGAWRRLDDAERVRQRLVYAGRPDLVRDLDRHDRPRGARVTALIRGPMDEALIPGGNQLISSFYLIKGESARRTVARVLTGSGRPRGSGFLVSPVLLMTNNHVLPNPSIAQGSTAQFDYLACPADHQIKPQTHRLDPALFFHTDPDLDYTLVGVQAAPVGGQAAMGASSTLGRGWNQLLRKSGKALVGERVNIIQHPHGGQQQVALRDNQIVNVVGSRIQYRADTQRGSSGSPVWSDDWNLVALHSAGIAPQNEHGQIITRNGQPWDLRFSSESEVAWIANEGVRISRITASLDVAHGQLGTDRQALLDMCFEPPAATRDMREFTKLMRILSNMGGQDTPPDDDPSPGTDTPIPSADGELSSWSAFDAATRKR